MDSLGSDVSAVTNRAFSSPASNLSFFWNSFFSCSFSGVCLFVLPALLAFLPTFQTLLCGHAAFFSQVSQNKTLDLRNIGFVLTLKLHPSNFLVLFILHTRSEPTAVSHWREVPPLGRLPVHDRGEYSHKQLYSWSHLRAVLN